MDTVFSFLKNIFIGFAVLIGILVVLAIVFGKRVRKQWEYEAEFRNDGGREFGEFDIEKSRIEKEERDFKVKVKLRMRHDGIKSGDSVRVLVDDALMLEGTTDQVGKICITSNSLDATMEEPRVGQMCRVEVGNDLSFTAALELD